MLKSIAAGIALSFALMGAALAQTCPAYNFALTNGTNANADQVMDNFNRVRNCLNAGPVLRDYIAALTLSTAGSSSTFGIAPGQATDSTNTSLMTLVGNYSKTTAPWTVGSGAGALDAGAITANNCYHVFLIQRPDTGVSDILISLSVNVPALPAGYTLFRRIGSVTTDGSAHWVAFTQLGDEFLWNVNVLNYASTGPTAPTIVNLSVPVGVQVTAIVAAMGQNGTSGQAYLLLQPPDQPQATANTYNSSLTWAPALSYGGGVFNVRTNYSGQIRVSESGAAGPYLLTLVTHGWIDPRGKNN